MGLFSRIGNLVRGFFGLFVRGIEESSPEALMESAKMEFRQRMAHYNEALARMAGIAERLKSQIKMKTTRAQDLERRILTNHRAGLCARGGRRLAGAWISIPRLSQNPSRLSPVRRAWGERVCP